MLQAGEAGAGIIDREPHAPAAQRLERAQQAFVVIDMRVLGDFQHDPLGWHSDQRAGKLTAQDGLGGCVHRQIDMIRKCRKRRLRDPDGGQLQQRAKADLGGFHEPLVR